MDTGHGDGSRSAILDREQLIAELKELFLFLGERWSGLLEKQGDRSLRALLNKKRKEKDEKIAADEDSRRKQEQEPEPTEWLRQAPNLSSGKSTGGGRRIVRSGKPDS